MPSCENKSSKLANSTATNDGMVKSRKAKEITPLFLSQNESDSEYTARYMILGLTSSPCRFQLKKVHHNEANHSGGANLGTYRTLEGSPVIVRVRVDPMHNRCRWP